MTQIDISGNRPPETVLPPEPAAATEALAAALALDGDEQRKALVGIVAAFPKFLDGWARLGDIGRDKAERYAMYRVGYHRGLDTLRQNGWRGSGVVRWEHETNRGFLRALAGLQRSATEIQELDESERCALFLLQLDPSWPPADLD